MNPKEMSSREAVVIGSAIILVAACYFWGHQTVQAWQFRSQGKKSPILWMIPQALPIEPANSATGTKLTQGSLEFEVPWTDLDQKKETRGEILLSNFVFTHGVGITVLAGKGVISELEGKRPGLTAQLEPVLGANAIQSDFALTKAMLDVTPEKLKPWMSRSEAVQVATLLNLKTWMLSDGGTGIFRIATQNWTGFQFGDPAHNPQHIRLELYAHKTDSSRSFWQQRRILAQESRKRI